MPSENTTAASEAAADVALFRKWKPRRLLGPCTRAIFFLSVAQFALLLDGEPPYAFAFPVEHPPQEEVEESGPPCCENSMDINLREDTNLHLIGIGAQKSASTYLHSLLKCHPYFYRAKSKEIHFFDYAHVNRSDYWNYLNIFKEVPDGLVGFEVTPSYLYVPGVPCQMKAIFPYIKILVILRDPADRMESQFQMTMRRTHVKCKHPTILEIVQTGIDQLRTANCSIGKGLDPQSWGSCLKCYEHESLKHRGRKNEIRHVAETEMCPTSPWEYVGRGLYASQLAWWFKFFDPSQFLILSYTDLIANPVATVNRVVDFMGVKVPFNINMVKGCKIVTHKKVYFPDATTAEAKRLLHEFYKGPNEDLYKLLAMHGFDFSPFPTSDLASEGSSETGQDLPFLSPTEKDSDENDSPMHLVNLAQLQSMDPTLKGSRAADQTSPPLHPKTELSRPNLIDGGTILQYNSVGSTLTVVTVTLVIVFTFYLIKISRPK